MKYRAYIDGLRAIAVMAVLSFHADLGFPGGYVGVDVFFVISGFLITGLILADIDGEGFSILAFWERRVRRIMPALAVVILATIVGGWFLLLPRGFKELGESVTAQALLGANFYFWKLSWAGTGYFDKIVEVKPLLHTWSLAVEEQFYLLLPFLLIVAKRFSRKTVVPAILVLGALYFSLSLYYSYASPSANFYLLPMRAWELLVGSLIAAISANRKPAQWLIETMSSSGILAIAIAMFCYTNATRFPGVAALLPCVGAALIIWSNTHALSTVGKFLSLRPVVFIGLISYSLYLWHWPIIVLFKYWHIGDIPPIQRLGLLVASIGLATLSWKFVETPFRRRQVLITRPEILSFAFVLTTVLALGGWLITLSDGVPSRIPAKVAQYLNDDNLPFPRQITLEAAQSGRFAEVGNQDTNQPIEYLVWGDSHARAAMPVIQLLCEEHSVRAVAATHDATAPLLNFETKNNSSLTTNCIPYNRAVVDFIRNHHVSNVIIIACWDKYTTEQGMSPVRLALHDTLVGLADAGTKVWIMRKILSHPGHVPDEMAAAVFHRQNPDELGLTEAEQTLAIRRQDTLFDGFTKQFHNVTVLDPTALFINSNHLYRVSVGDKLLYWDNSHLSYDGAMLLRPIFEPIFNTQESSQRMHTHRVTPAPPASHSSPGPIRG